MMLFLVLVAVLSVSSAHDLRTVISSEEELTRRIDAAAHYLCINQHDSGAFLYKVTLHETTLDVHPTANDFPRQAGALYSLALYYKLHQHHSSSSYSLTDCIQRSIDYMNSQSTTIPNNTSTTAKLIDGNTGATALTILSIIDICIANNKLCIQLSSSATSWLHGLLSMHKRILSTKQNSLQTPGAFSRNVKDANDAYSAYYDSEAYLALSRVIQYQSALDSILSTDLYNAIALVVDMLDEYYIQYDTLEDTHWLLQAWYARWMTTADTNELLVDTRLVSQLMRQKLLTIDIEVKEEHAQCYLMDALLDVLDAVRNAEQRVVLSYRNDSSNELSVLLDSMQAQLWEVLGERYDVMMEKQMFMGAVSGVYFETRLDGGFVGDGASKEYEMRVDYTQHCAVTMMKMFAVVYVENDDVNDGYMNYADGDADGGRDVEIVSGDATNYDVMISAICIVVLIVLVNVIFFYWCYYYPKEQKQRNDLFWLGQTMDSAPSDAVPETPSPRS